LISVDTNVLLRLITSDDDEQFRIASEFVEDSDIYVSLLALVECEWVLRSGYGWSVARIADALRALLSAPRVHAELPNMALWGIERYRAGADFTDMIHLVASRDADGFATFDRRLQQRAGAEAPVPIIQLGS
jgi:predicted nucleic-acid-binding protein